jgi:hypothetical protein
MGMNEKKQEQARQHHPTLVVDWEPGSQNQRRRHLSRLRLVLCPAGDAAPLKSWGRAGNENHEEHEAHEGE